MCSKVQASVEIESRMSQDSRFGARTYEQISVLQCLDLISYFGLFQKPSRVASAGKLQAFKAWGKKLDKVHLLHILVFVVHSYMHRLEVVKTECPSL